MVKSACRAKVVLFLAAVFGENVTGPLLFFKDLRRKKRLFNFWYVSHDQ